MSDPTRSPGSPLEFDRAAPAGATGALACSACGAAIGSRYFTAGDAVVCEPCRMRLEQERREQSRILRFLRAGSFGFAAAVLGAGLWWIVTQTTGYEIGLIAIVVGFAVGAAVRVGSHGVGGWPYQILAVGLTYAAIVTSYVPAVAEGLLLAMSQPPVVEETLDVEGVVRLDEPTAALPPLPDEAAPTQAAAAEAPAQPAVDRASLNGRQTALLYVLSFVFSLGLPFMMGLQNAIGLLIIGFALWEAWRLNQKTDQAFGGPFDVGRSNAAAS